MPEDRNVTYDPLVAFMALFENVQAVSSQQDPFEGLGIEERLKLHIVNGIKKKLDGHLAEAMETYTPLQIINDILLDGMKTVGELFRQWASSSGPARCSSRLFCRAPK